MLKRRRLIYLIFIGILILSFRTDHIGGYNLYDNNVSKEEYMLSILTYNVRNCRGLDNITDYQRVADIILRIKPHIVAIQELDSATQRSGGIVALNELAVRTQMYPTYSASISYQGGKYGIGILSCEKPLNYVAVPLPGREEKRSILIAEFKDYFFCCTHLSLTEEDRLKSVETINDLFHEPGKPVFLAGDFNAQPESEVLTNLKKNWLLLNNPDQPTIPADNPSRCIDYIFSLKAGNPNIYFEESSVEKEPVASDHLPVRVKIKIYK